MTAASFFQSYLFAYLFWFGVAAGALGILMLHHLTGGAWGDLIRPILEAASLTLPWLALLFIPVLFGLRTLYPWANPDLVTHDALLQHKAIYLNIPFFCFRALIYFGGWSFMALYFGRGKASPSAKSKRSAPGLVLYVFSLTFSALDWMMSLEPHWYSTVYEVMVMIGQMLAAFAFSIGALAWLGRSRRLNEEFPSKPFLDLGNMLLAFVMLSAYMAFSQYIVIWSGDLPDEITWYLHRQEGGWFWVAMALIVFQFFVPFFALLGRRNKQRLDRLSRIAGLLFAMCAVNTFWLIKPLFHPDAFMLHGLDLSLFATVGVCWLMLFMNELGKRPSPIGFYAGEPS